MRIQLSRDEREYIYHMAKHVLDVSDRAVHEERERVVQHLLEHAAASGNAEVRVKLQTFVKIVRKTDEREKPIEAFTLDRMDLATEAYKRQVEREILEKEANMSWRSPQPVKPGEYRPPPFQYDETDQRRAAEFSREYERRKAQEASDDPQIPASEVFRMVTEEELHGQPGKDLGDSIRERVRQFMRRKENVTT
jgi:hypothetical protein